MRQFLSEVRAAIEERLKWVFVALLFTLIVTANVAAILVALVCMRYFVG